MSRVLALLGSSHPLPSIAVAAIAAGLAAAVGVPPASVAVIGIVILLNQLSVGLSNDAVDAELDRRSGRSGKPVADGRISARGAMTAGIGLALASVGLSLLLGWQVALAQSVFLASGWAYNLRLKRTIFSPIPYLIGFGSIPAIATLALSPPALPPWWATAAGALIGLSAHFANVLTDLDADLAYGVRGLPQRLGARVSGMVSVLCLVLASGLIAVFGDGPDSTQRLVAVVSVVIAVVGLAAAIMKPRGRALFRIVIASAAVDVGLLIAVGSTIVG